jgi:hypothetical protein
MYNGLTNPMPRKIRAKVEREVDESKVMSVLDAMPVKIVEPVKMVEPVELKVKPVKVMKVKKEPTEQKQPKEQKQRAPNAWLEFLKDYRMKHPEKSYKECLQDGKTEYKSA